MSYMKGDHDDPRFFPGNTDAEEYRYQNTVTSASGIIPTHTFPLIDHWGPHTWPDTNPTVWPTPITIPQLTVVKEKSDGSSTDYYKIPAGSTDLIDLIEYKNMNFAIGNIFKACFRLGEKADTDRAYDLRKILFFAQRELDRIAGKSSP